jgi:aminodeoxyfutalosine synthase
MATSLDGLLERVEEGAPLSDADVAALADTRDIIALGMLATTVRRKLHGGVVTFVRVQDLQRGSSADSVLNPATGPDPEAGEIRVLHTPDTLEAAVGVVTAAREFAGDIPLSAFSLFELTRLPEGLAVVLHALRQAGLEWIALAPVDRLPSPESTLEAATDAGLKVARLTVDRPIDRPWVDLCRDVARYQSSLGSIRAFAPLPRTIDATQPTTGYEDVRRIALSRVLAGVDVIQVDWALYGPKLAQVALTFGADDIDSVDSGGDDSKGRRRSAIEEIRRGIRAAGFEPVERDGRFAERESSRSLESR